VTLLFDGSGPAIAMMTRVWAKTLRAAGATSDLVALVTPRIGGEIRAILSRDKIRVVTVESVPLPLSLRTAEAQSRWHSVFTKLRAWQLIEYDRLTYMDMDVLVEMTSREDEKNPEAGGIESIFTVCPPASDLCVARDLAHSEEDPMANVGVMVLRPSLSRFEHMLESMKHITSIFRYPEQEWITKYAMNPENRMHTWLLPHDFNTCSLRDSPSSVKPGMASDDRYRKTWGASRYDTEQRNIHHHNVVIHHFCGPAKPPHYRVREAFFDSDTAEDNKGSNRDRRHGKTQEKRRLVEKWYDAYRSVDKCFRYGACINGSSGADFILYRNDGREPCIHVNQGGDRGFCVGALMGALISTSTEKRILKIGEHEFDDTDDSSYPEGSEVSSDSAISSKTSNSEDGSSGVSKPFSVDLLPKSGFNGSISQNSKASGIALDASLRSKYISCWGRKNTSATQRSFESRSIYQIVTDRFSKARDEKENVRSWTGRICRNLSEHCGGKWKGIEENLIYLADLGISAVWMSPFGANVEREDCYHGYCPKGLGGTQVNVKFGTKAELLDLLKALRSEDIATLGDIVINHLGSKLEDLTLGKLEPNPFGDWTPTNPHFHDPHEPGWCKPNMTPKEMVDCSLYGAIDLNHESPLVEELVIKMVRNNVKEFCLNAVRLDAARHVHPRFIFKLSEAMRENADLENCDSKSCGNNANGCQYANTHHSSALTFAEVFHGSFDYVASFQHVSDGIFNFPLYFTLLKVFTEENANIGVLLSEAKRKTSEFFQSPNLAINFIENHDVPRFLSLAGSNEVLYLNAFVCVLFWEGIPSLYYGSELGVDGESASQVAEKSEKINGQPKEDVFDDEIDEPPPYLPDQHRKPLWESARFQDQYLNGQKNHQEKRSTEGYESDDHGPERNEDNFPSVGDIHFRWTRSLLAVRDAFGVWNQPQVTLLKSEKLFAFSRGSVITILTNSGRDLPDSSLPTLLSTGPMIEVSIEIVSMALTKDIHMCNVLPPYKCTILREPTHGNTRKDKRDLEALILKHEGIQALPAVYVPMHESTWDVMDLLLFSNAMLPFPNNDGMKLSEGVKRIRAEDLRRPDPNTVDSIAEHGHKHKDNLRNAKPFSPEPAWDDNNWIGIEGTYRLHSSPASDPLRQGLILTVNKRSIFFRRSDHSGFCLFKALDAEMECVRFMKMLRSSLGWATALTAPHKTVESVLVVLHWLQADNYYHFVIEVLPYLIEEISRKQKQKDPIPGITPGHYIGIPTEKHLPFITNILESLGISSSLLIYINQAETQIIRTAEVVVLSGVASQRRPVVMPSPETLRSARSWLRNAVELHTDSLQTPWRLLWIGREGSRSRRLTVGGENGRLVKTLKERFPFLDIIWMTPGHDSTVAKIRTEFLEVGTATIIGGVHGAGLSNAIFAHPDASLLEVLPLVPGMINYHYWTLCAALNLDYWFLPVQVPERSISHEHAFGVKLNTIAEVEVDVQEVVNIVETILLHRR